MKDETGGKGMERFKDGGMERPPKKRGRVTLRVMKGAKESEWRVRV